jgi:RNA polymerase sigma-70 factor (ECF subfamily)
VGGSDWLLAARLAAGDDHALAELCHLAPAVHGAALRVLGDDAAAQDVVQDVLVELWRNPGRYDPAAGTLRAYLIMLARHRAVDQVRSELRRAARQERSHQLSPGQPGPSPCDEVLASESAAVVRAAIRLLPDSQRRIVELAYYGD